MNHQRSLRCLGAAPLLLAFPAEAVLGGVTPAPNMLQVFAEGATAAGQGSAAARLAPGSRARIVRAQGIACPWWRRRWIA